MIKWIFFKIFKRKYFMSVDYSNGVDYTVETYGYRVKDGKFIITRQKVIQ